MRVIGRIRAAGRELTELGAKDPARFRARVAAGDVAAVLVASLDRLPAAWLADAELFELFERHDVALVAAAERIDTSTPAGRLALAAARRRGDSSPAGG